MLFDIVETRPSNDERIISRIIRSHSGGSRPSWKLTART
jgi:hypothetical protein